MGIKVIKDTSRVDELMKETEYIMTHAIKVGIIGDQDSELIKIASVHEFGATINPKNAKALAIPLPVAGDTSPADHSDLFIPKGRSILARKKGTGIEAVFILAQSVTIPERSYIRATFDENKEDIMKTSQKLLHQLLDGKITGENLYNRLGLYLQTLITNKMRNMKEPRNSPLTVANKGVDNPLIGTGRLRQAVSYEVIRL